MAPRAREPTRCAVLKRLAAPPLRALGELLGRLHAHQIHHEARCKDVIANEAGELALIDRDPKDAPIALAASRDGALLCLARCEYLRLRGGAKLSQGERLRVLGAYLDAAKNALPLRGALALVARALDAEIARHRANPALVAEFGPLEAGAEITRRGAYHRSRCAS